MKEGGIVEPLDILDIFRKAAHSQGAVAVSLPAPRPWTAVVPCVICEDSLLMELPASFPVIAPDKHPRVSFSIGPAKGAPEIRGDGIAHFVKGDARRVRLEPYRILIGMPFDSGSADFVIERRRNAWQNRQQNAPASKGLHFWFRAARGISFPLSIFPVLIGTSCSLVNGHVDWLLFACALVGGVAAHAATNLFSDYSDYVKGVDTTNALSSHTGALVDELAEPARILLAAAACVLITAVIGGFLVSAVGWPILVFGIAGILGGFFYTGGPRGLKYIGLGEASTGFLMGPLMVCGAYYVQERTLAVPVILMSIAIGLLVSAVSYGNNIRDAFFDQAAGITTMPVRIGWQRALVLFTAIIGLPYLLVGCAVCVDTRFAPALIVILSAPWAISIALRLGRGAKDLAELSERAAHSILPLQVIKLHTRFCLLMLVGCVVVPFVSGWF